MLDVETGRPVPVSQAGDHTTAVADIHVSEPLKHFLTCSADGTLKVFDDQKRLEQVRSDGRGAPKSRPPPLRSLRSNQPPSTGPIAHLLSHKNGAPRAVWSNGS